LSQIYQTQPTTKKVFDKYLEIINKFGSELDILMNFYDREKMHKEEPLLFEALEQINQGNIILEPGYDGEYGKVIISFNKAKKIKEKRLF